jgi:hypothetical protein
MLRFRSLQPSLQVFLLLLVFLFASFCSAADAPPVLTVGESGAYLYGRQDDESEKIARLEKGEELIPLAYATGTVSWYMVKTQKGVIGWVRSSDVKAGDRVQKTFREVQLSTWSARTSTGRAFAGTWIGDDLSTGAASGTWTLQDGAGKTVMSGTWSASKSPKGWNGTWRALLAGQSGGYSGTWSANLRLAPNARLAELFEAAVKEVVGGSWKAGPYSGSWSIRAAKAK